MKIEFNYQRNGEVKQCSFSTPPYLNNRDKQYLERFVVRMMINYIYDHEIEKEEWISGYMYDDGVCLGEINYVGNYITKEDK